MKPYHHNGGASPTESLSSADSMDSPASNGNRVGFMSSVYADKVRGYAEVAYLTGRTKVVTNHFPTAMGIDDFLHRLEIALYAYGFNGDNAIGKNC